MMLAVPDVLDPATLARVRGMIDAAEWTDGNATSTAGQRWWADTRGGARGGLVTCERCHRRHHGAVRLYFEILRQQTPPGDLAGSVFLGA